MKKSSPSLRPLRKYKAKVIIGPLLKLFEVACELFIPFLTKYMIDVGVKERDWKYTLALGGAMLAMALVGFLVTLLAQWMAARVSSDYGYDLRKEMYAHLGSLSEGELSRYGKGKALTLLNSDSFILQNGVMMYMRLLARSPMLILGSLILSFVIDWRAGLIFLGVVLLSSAVLFLVAVLSPKRYLSLQGDLDSLSTLGSDTLRGSRPIRAFNKESDEKKRFDDSNEKYRHDGLSVGRLNAIINPLTFLFMDLGLALIVYFGGVLIGRSETGFTSGSVIALISYLTSSLAALVMFSRLIVSLNRALASQKRVDAFLSIPPSIVGGSLQEATASINLYELKDVSLTYGEKGSHPAVSGLSFSIPSGSTIGFIGGTGSGKSSTIALLERLYDPSEGSILYKGVPLRDYDLSSIRQDIALVSQKPSIFRGTVRSNLLLGRKDATEEEMIAALKDAQAYEYVSKYPDFLDHKIEQGGLNLSGGQKQRLLIAQALLHGGSLLILDDSTSALDFLTDEKVRKAIAKKPGLTKIIVSQRATSLMGCDAIYVYDNGRIVASGTHEELLKKCPLYKSIYEMQVAAQ